MLFKILFLINFFERDVLFTLFVISARLQVFVGPSQKYKREKEKQIWSLHKF